MNTRLARGVMTVEAAVIFPMVTVLACLLLTCIWYRHNVNYYTAAAAETALRGNAAVEGGMQNPEGVMRETAAGRAADQPMPGSAPQAQVSSNGWGSSVSFSGQRFPAFQKWFSWSREVAVPCVRPAEQLRRNWRARRPYAE